MQEVFNGDCKSAVHACVSLWLNEVRCISFQPMLCQDLWPSMNVSFLEFVYSRNKWNRLCSRVDSVWIEETYLKSFDRAHSSSANDPAIL